MGTTDSSRPRIVHFACSVVVSPWPIAPCRIMMTSEEKKLRCGQKCIKLHPEFRSLVCLVSAQRFCVPPWLNAWAKCWWQPNSSFHHLLWKEIVCAWRMFWFLAIWLWIWDLEWVCIYLIFLTMHEPAKHKPGTHWAVLSKEITKFSQYFNMSSILVCQAYKITGEFDCG